MRQKKEEAFHQIRNARVKRRIRAGRPLKSISRGAAEHIAFEAIQALVVYSSVIAMTQSRVDGPIDLALRARQRDLWRTGAKHSRKAVQQNQSRQAPARLHTATLLRPSRRSLRSYPLVR